MPACKPGGGKASRAFAPLVKYSDFKAGVFGHNVMDLCAEDNGDRGAVSNARPAAAPAKTAAANTGRGGKF